MLVWREWYDSIESRRHGPPRRGDLHLRHDPARHARARHDHPRPAGAGEGLSWRRHRAGRANVRALQHRLGAHAVRGLAHRRRALGSVWTTPRRAAVELRSWLRLPADGDGAHARLAV